MSGLDAHIRVQWLCLKMLCSPDMHMCVCLIWWWVWCSCGYNEVCCMGWWVCMGGGVVAEAWSIVDTLIGV